MRPAPLLGFGVLGGFGWHGLGWGLGCFWVGDFVGGFLGDVSFLGAMVFVFPFPFLPFSFCYWGLRGSEPWGCLWTFLSFLFYFLFFVDIGTFMNIEHDIALLHMSTYIAERWHRAHGLLYVLGC